AGSAPPHANWRARLAFVYILEVVVMEQASDADIAIAAAGPRLDDAGTTTEGGAILAGRCWTAQCDVETLRGELKPSAGGKQAHFPSVLEDETDAAEEDVEDEMHELETDGAENTTLDEAVRDDHHSETRESGAASAEAQPPLLQVVERERHAEAIDEQTTEGM
ncbi:unnamed protein product, partial [Prorocentrum cordatum]